jgi:hypothetical protein
MLKTEHKTCFLYFSLMFSTFFGNAQTTTEIRIDSILAYDTLKVKTPKSLYLDAKDDDVTFFINNCKSSDSIHFQYLGIDKEPVLWRTNNIRYTNIKGGEYAFILTQHKNTTIDTLSILPIYVVPTIVEQPLFIPSLVFSLLLIFVSIVFLWLSYNFRQKMKVLSLRNQIASDLHDEVGSTLSSIAVLSKVLRRNIAVKAPESLDILDKILLISKETIISLRDSVWAINPANDSFEHLMSKMRSYASEMILGEVIELNYTNVFEDEKRFKTWHLSMEQRRNVYLMFKESVHNIVKHAKATSVDIAISHQDNMIRIFIKDNGRGFDLENEKEGNGLENMKRRAKSCFIDLEVKSVLQQGTSIVMLIPEL